MEVGIVSYGGYVPRYRIKPEEIGRIWGVDGKSMGKGLMIYQKSVPSPDEDVVTIATEAARYMMARVPEVDPKDIGAIYVGSESHPYAVKPTSTIVAEAIEATPAMTAADMEFACKAGTAGIQACMGLVGAGMVRYGVAIGADTSQGAPGDALEYSASAGGAAYLIGSEKVIARINKTLSFTHTRLLEEGGAALPQARRQVHRRAGLLQAHHLRRTDDVRGHGHHRGRLQVRCVPPAQRQVPHQGGQAAGIQRRADPSSWASATSRSSTACSPPTSGTHTAARCPWVWPTCWTTPSPGTGSS